MPIEISLKPPTEFPARLPAPEGERTLARDRALLLPLTAGEPFDPLHTFRCGQVFRWHRHGDTWYGPFGQASLAVRVTPGGLEVRAQGLELRAADAWCFLGLDTPLSEVYRRLRPDPHLARAIEAAPGLRILRQDPWECVAGYICSQWNNIPKIELSTGRIARDWGTVHTWDGGVEVPVLPPPERLAELDPEELKSCALGYRCKYLVRTAQRVAAGDVDLPSLRRQPYRKALAALLALPGIGRKVADCILLFSLDQPEAFPVDVWVRRVVHELYGEALSAYLPDAAARVEKGLTPREYDATLRFAWDRWGLLAGYAQQYLFYTRRAGL